MLAEIEAIVNSRLLVYVDDEVRDTITPSHFISLRNSSGLFSSPDDGHDPNFRVTSSSADVLLDGWQKGQKCSINFGMPGEMSTSSV